MVWRILLSGPVESNSFRNPQRIARDCASALHQLRRQSEGVSPANGQLVHSREEFGAVGGLTLS